MHGYIDCASVSLTMIWMCHLHYFIWHTFVIAGLANARNSGLLLLYRPRDISNDCAFSHRLRYDLSFGMGMSDSITLVFRTLSEIDYECIVEIVADADDVYILLVIRFPGNIGPNCAVNRDAFTVLKKNICLRLCDLLAERDVYSPYFVVSVRGRIRFRFLSNSSINSDINANLYQVTATAARLKPQNGCSLRNETICIIKENEFCFTSGVVCDGIKNCGVTDWFDERKSSCGLPVEKLAHAPVVAVVAAILFALLTAGHIILKCLPPLANSFFIFNANEDNRLCIDPVLKPPEARISDIENTKKMSLIPVFSSSSSSNDSENKKVKCDIAHEQQNSNYVRKPKNIPEEETPQLRNTILKTVTATIHRKFMSISGRGRDATNSRDSTNIEENIELRKN